MTADRRLACPPAMAESFDGAVDDLVRHVVARSASLSERGEKVGLLPRSTPTAVIERRLEDWRVRVAGDDVAAWETMCRTRRIHRPEGWVTDVTAAAGARLPAWAMALRAVLARSSNDPSNSDRDAMAQQTKGGAYFMSGGLPVRLCEGAGANLFAPAIGLLRESLRGLGPASRDLVTDLCSYFAGLLLSTFSGIIDELPPWDRDAGGAWAQVLREYPAAGHCLGLLLEGYVGYARELCRRLDDDAGLVVSLAGLRPGTEVRATHCWPGAGDHHSGLRSVTIVELAGGSRVVYKPKDLRHLDVLADIVRASGADLGLPPRIARRGYGWEAFVGTGKPGATDVPADAGQCRQAARDLGAWVFWFNVLGSSDVVGENVRVVGGRIVPVDVEAWLRFSLVDPSSAPWQPTSAGTGLISSPLLREAPGRVSDFGLVSAAATLLACSKDVIAGYSEAAAAAAKQKPAVLESLGRVGNVPVRAILRNTWVYDTLINDSLSPSALSDGVARDLVIERLWVAHVRSGLPPAIVEAEAHAIRRLDVPLFFCLPHDTHLFRFTPEDKTGLTRVAASLAEPPAARAHDRLGKLGPQADPADLDAVRAVMFCAAENRNSEDWRSEGGRSEGASTAARSRFRSGRPSTEPRCDWQQLARAAATETARFLCSGGPAGIALTAGLSYVARNDVVVLVPVLPFDLFSGSPGIAIALTSLVQICDDPVIAEATEMIYRAAETGADLLADDMVTRARRRRPLPSTGAYERLAALVALYSSTAQAGPALGRCAEVLAAAGGATFPTGPRAIEALTGLSAALGLAQRQGAPTTAISYQQVTHLLEVSSSKAETSGLPRFPSRLGLLIPSERALAAWAFACAGRGPQLAAPGLEGLDGSVAPGSGDRLVVAALNPSGIEPLASEGLSRLETVSLMAELEVSLVASRNDERFAAPAACAGALLAARRNATGRWFGDTLAPDRFRPSAVWGTCAVAYLFSGLSDPTGFTSIRLFEPIWSRK